MKNGKEFISIITKVQKVTNIGTESNDIHYTYIDAYTNMYIKSLYELEKIIYLPMGDFRIIPLFPRKNVF